jgi:peptidoglycan hydrolase-like protein with peptidoglycan-binding domain
VDGNFGPGTAKAVAAFQQKNNLGSDGVVGQGTWAALWA